MEELKSTIAYFIHENRGLAVVMAIVATLLALIVTLIGMNPYKERAKQFLDGKTLVCETSDTFDNIVEMSIVNGANLAGNNLYRTDLTGIVYVHLSECNIKNKIQ